ncbi:MAG: CoA pyrophosphatase [Bryobacteraceae bacterium]|nr:CoA pyrophosphatase [Bryobacteraceae bacterium]
MKEPEAAVAILRTRAPGESVLLIRRAEREGDSWSGHWSFPGGRRDAGDADLIETALRELEEECGIRLARDHMEAALPPTIARRKVGRFLLVAPFVFRAPAPLATTLDHSEAVEAKWIPLSVLRDPERHRLLPIPGRYGEVRFPGIELGGMPLWGFTYRLITDWLELVPSGEEPRPAGFEAAESLLAFLLENGLALDCAWREENGTTTAVVKGTIPVEAVFGQWASRASPALRVNYLEVRPDGARLAGLAFEEYVIRAEGGDGR